VLVFFFDAFRPPSVYAKLNLALLSLETSVSPQPFETQVSQLLPAFFPGCPATVLVIVRLSG